MRIHYNDIRSDAWIQYMAGVYQELPEKNADCKFHVWLDRSTRFLIDEMKYDRLGAWF